MRQWLIRGAFTTLLSSPPRPAYTSSFEGTLVAIALKLVLCVGGEEDTVFSQREGYFQEYCIVNVNLGYRADLILTKPNFLVKCRLV